jgi:glycosyltransferase involved in cell wall biosynthesis
MPKAITSHRITFFSQSLQRTGSEVVLFNLLTYANPDWDITLVSLYPGELAPLLPQSIKQVVLYPKKLRTTFTSRLVHYLKREFVTPLILRRYVKSVWYINTISLPAILLYAEKLKVRCILHTYELEQMYTHFSEEQIKRIVEYPELVIANAAITTALLRKYGRKTEIEVFYPTMNTQIMKRDHSRYLIKRKELGIGENQFLWIMSGTRDANKNPLLFIELAGLVLKTHKQARFMWIGGEGEPKLEASCKAKMEELKLGEAILWPGHVGADYLDYFNCADGFVLTSRIESFSLVTLEALLMGLPVVANDCGGVAEILVGKFGSLIGGEERAEHMAVEMCRYMDKIVVNDPEKQRARALEFDIKAVADPWNNVVQNFLDQPK